MRSKIETLILAAYESGYRDCQRERDRFTVDGGWEQHAMRALLAQASDVLGEQRKWCAKVADAEVVHLNDAADRIATAIRALGAP